MVIELSEDEAALLRGMVSQQMENTKLLLELVPGPNDELHMKALTRVELLYQLRQKLIL